MEKLIAEKNSLVYCQHINNIKKEIAMLKKHAITNHEAYRKNLKRRNICSDEDHTLLHGFQDS